jgi:hypothetical protein
MRLRDGMLASQVAKTWFYYLSKTQNLVFLVFDASNDAKPPESAVDSANRGRDDGVEVLCFCGICKHEVLCEPSDLPLGKKPILFVPE